MATPGTASLRPRPESLAEAGELARLYRAKDQVEKDFQTIKSVCKLRPVRHQTDPKVRAHVTLCMLALLLERAIEAELGGRTTAAAALDALSPVHLNRLRLSPQAPPVYSVTRTQPQQDELLRALGMEHLTDDVRLGEQLTAR